MMSWPFKRYCHYLADRLKMPVKRMLNEVDSDEISNWMAYDLTCSEDWINNYNIEKELELSKNLSRDQKVNAFKALFGGKVKGNK